MTSTLAVLAAADPSIVTVGGLPLHPLVVHVVVVLLPLSALGLLAIMVRPTWRARYAGLVIVGLVIGALAAMTAVYAGEQLALVTGVTEEHRRWGKWLQYDALALVPLAAAWVWLQRGRGDGRAHRHSDGARPLTAIVGIGAALLAVGSLVLTTLVGHSGATDVWKSRIAAVSTPAPAETVVAKGYSMAQIAKHAKTSDCWSVINGSVYNLTHWINKHPGGPSFIVDACGVDASSAFNRQHSGQSGPAQFLADYKIGSLQA